MIEIPFIVQASNNAMKKVGQYHIFTAFWLSRESPVRSMTKHIFNQPEK